MWKVLRCPLSLKPDCSGSCMRATGLCSNWPPCLGSEGMILMVEAEERRDAALGEVVRIGARVRELSSIYE